MKLLKIGISGVRGIVGDTITPELVMDFACAFGTFLRTGKVLVGRDTRISGPMLHSAAISALLSTGCDVIDLGICPAPILQYLVKKKRTRGAVSISAGHNDAEWNALTFIDAEGTYLNEFQGEEILDLYHLEKFRKASAEKLGMLTVSQDHFQTYFKALRNFLDVDKIKKTRFKVVIDACNGGGAGIIDLFCENLGCELIPVNNTPDGYFPHDPEPRPRYGSEVASIIKITGADIGFLLNSDVSRVSLVTETGETLSEEYTFPLVADYYLKNNPGTVITNQSTSRKIEDVAERHGCRVLRTRVGQSYIIQSLIYEEAVLAGDGSGSAALRKFQPAFDGFLTMGLILESLAAEEQTASEKARKLPKYHIIKHKVYCPPHKAHSLVGRVRKLYSRSQTDLLDGVRVETKDGWIHVRTSATEPMIRIISESSSRKKAEIRIEKVIHYLSQYI
ncbi:MAG: phosphoglucosamine mutase [Candidatus Aminicenantes bacterium]|jgi:phosphomannomutase